MRTASFGGVLVAALLATAARADDFKCPEGARDSGKRKGQPRWCEMMVNGRLMYHGPYWRFHEDGKLSSKETYDRGNAVGDAETWHKNGQLASKGAYKDGEAVGTWRHWDEAGRIRSETQYALPRATRTEFWANGQKRAAGSLLDGGKVGTWTLWDKAGKEQGRCELGEGVVALPPGPACKEIAEKVDPKGFGRPTPAVEVAADGSFTIRVGSEGWSLTPPAGWVADAKAGAGDRLAVLLHPKGGAAWAGPTTMYLRPVYRDGKAFGKAVEAERESFKKAVLDYGEKALEKGKTAMGRAFTARTLSYRATRPGSGGMHIVNEKLAYEVVAYLDASDQVVLVAVAACADEKAQREAKAALLTLARSARKAGGK